MTASTTSARAPHSGGFARVGRIAAQSSLLAGVWFIADQLARAVHLPVPGGVVGLVLLLVLLFCGGVAPRWVKAGADWLLSDMLLFFIPAAVAAVQYGGLFRADGWRLALVVVGGTLMVMVAVAFAVEQAARLERRLALRRVRHVRDARHLARA
ncbi:holin-like protein [Paraburkholderia tropica]|uniref:Holin-like protein n=1 Tax=Paraburkholderia tropica TaxID=92647 RepID=A0AAQ1JTF7_9BURK|nr:CidA/LrgA family protein [Paraburkholderia tropica]MBB2998475.1 holin-like protein [Paraburkholderia tropica]MBB6317517.1 holin-like protein [Paraburkholderia tropica]RQN34123.1 CidA/LrgA family protein [Paraburkholderia tropica]SEJ46666.1 holin-like protein [Paraburkholderia tropica]